MDRDHCKTQEDSNGSLGVSHVTSDSSVDLTKSARHGVALV